MSQDKDGCCTKLLKTISQDDHTPYKNLATLDMILSVNIFFRLRIFIYVPGRWLSG